MVQGHRKSSANLHLYNGWSVAEIIKIHLDLHLRNVIKSLV